MKVNFILPGLGDSGGIQVIRKYVQLLNDYGIDAVIYSSIIANNLWRYPTVFKNKAHQCYCTVKTIAEKGSKADVNWIPKINGKYIRTADHTIATMWATAYDVDKLPNKCGKKWYFIQGLEIWDNKERGLASYKLPLNKIVISTWINNQLKDNLGIGPFPIVYNGIDTEVFKPINDEISYNKTPGETRTILMLNHNNPVKGVEDGLKVIEKIRNVHPNTKFIMFGLRDKSNLPDYIDYYQNPNKKTLVELYQRSDIFLFPSHADGWGLTPIEAMACGCAVVGTNTGFVLDLGMHKENMMISEPGDVDAMINNVLLLIDDSILFLSIREEAKKTIKKLDWKKSSENFVRLLSKD